MSIKADTWIAKMATEQEMIRPFENKLVRTVDGHKVISYGLSSYGYDIRVSNHFRIFTNVHGTVVDPKAFDARSKAPSKPMEKPSEQTAS